LESGFRVNFGGKSLNHDEVDASFPPQVRINDIDYKRALAVVSITFENIAHGLVLVWGSNGVVVTLNDANTFFDKRSPGFCFNFHTVTYLKDWRFEGKL